MENSVFENTAQPSSDFNRFSIPIKWGLIIGLLSCILATINFMFIINNYVAFLVFTFVMYVVTIILYGVTGVQQRKAMGGYITFKEAFQAIFLAILISTIITSVYGVIYTKFIDPTVVDRIKEGTLAFMENMNVPEEKLDQTAADIDQQFEDSLKPGKLLYAIAKSLIISSIFGFICALIVKKQKPVFPGQ
jgi:hypothetical protein